MKKTIFTLFVIMSAFAVSAREISSEAWDELRDIHALYVKNIEGKKWDPETMGSDDFLENKLKEFFNSLLEEKNQLKAENADLTKDNSALQAENADLTKDNSALQAENADLTKDNSALQAENEKLKSESNVYFVIIIILITLLAVLFLIPIICLMKTRKKKESQETVDGGCPRCGSVIDLSQKRCSNCGTQI